MRSKRNRQLNMDFKFKRNIKMDFMHKSSVQRRNKQTKKGNSKKYRKLFFCFLTDCKWKKH
uniref:Uncharacterized protein n=1 Tax=Anguilla anguilla TaxID=7936 RepID=A0A0E9XFF5_ANGAN